MTPRERTLAILLVAGIMLGGGALLGYMFVYTPLQEKWAQSRGLETEIGKLDEQLASLNKLKPRIAEMKRQSLPADADLEKTKLKYQQMLEQLRPTGLATTGDYKVSFSKQQPTSGTPEIAPKKAAYTRLEFIVKIDNANIWQVVDFLTRYYQVDLLHQITELRITRANKPTEARTQLDVYMTCEALIVDGAEPRSTLFPVSSAVAAIGGYRAVEAVINKPELTRRILPQSPTPVLASRGRDYSLIVRNDMFYGMLPKPEAEPSFAIARISDVTISKPEETPAAVRVRASGKGSTGATAEAKVTAGDLFPKGPLSVKDMSIVLPKVDEEIGVLGSSSTATISVTVTSGEGEKKETTFKVAMGPEQKPGPPPTPGIDIASAIKLVGFASSTEGAATTVTALIFDSANPYVYKIVGKGKTVEVIREWSSTTKTWRKDADYEQPAGVLAFSDDFSSTKRTFRVIAIESDSIVVAEIGAPPAKASAKLPGIGKFPVGGGRPKQGPAEPLAVLAGSAAAAVPQPVYYRWPLGKSLKDLLESDPKKSCRLPADEVKKILKRVSDAGPIDIALIAAGN
jgi:hypothetical protein